MGEGERERERRAYERFAVTANATRRPAATFVAAAALLSLSHSIFSFFFSRVASPLSHCLFLSPFLAHATRCSLRRCRSSANRRSVKRGQVGGYYLATAITVTAMAVATTTTANERRRRRRLVAVLVVPVVLFLSSTLSVFLGPAVPRSLSLPLSLRRLPPPTTTAMMVTSTTTTTFHTLLTTHHH